MGALGVIALVAVLFGGVQTTMSLSEHNGRTGSKTPVVEVQAIHTDNAAARAHEQ